MIGDSTNTLGLISEMMSTEDMHLFLMSALAFKRHDVIAVKHAKLLYTIGLLEISPVKGFVTVQLCCFRFTTAGQKAIDDIQVDMGLSAEDFKALPDPFELDVKYAGSTSQFVMHHRRLLIELASSRKRVRDIVDRYPVGIEDELKSKNSMRRPFLGGQ